MRPGQKIFFAAASLAFSLAFCPIPVKATFDADQRANVRKLSAPAQFPRPGLSFFGSPSIGTEREKAALGVMVGCPSYPADPEP